ncbi:hypothetical protein [Jannaschia rubra]|uniref:Inner membrane protein YjdF n=1 Tax=Jannaschia rubra TaxID=282197 RepID=A0A0M6XVH3_9RHOB|nr:hypothetical protein [Jannaschia rubra]CTQ34587.1 hypothetical protein JAN5088_03383 [Jannaschia rubra]SFG72518.1 hypothetical protein SAMN04488517_11259 [Jannaschia rubra]
MTHPSASPLGTPRPAARPVLRALPWAAVALASGAGAVLGDWQFAWVAAACAGLALLPKAFTAVSGIVFPAGFTTGILIFCAAALLAGEWGGLYVTLWWWDLALHLVASSVLAVVGMALAMTATGGARPRVAVWVLAVLAFAFSMMVGAMWELMEFSIDAIFGTNAQRSGLPDTMGDQAVNLLGATLGAVAGHARVDRGARWPLARLLGRFMADNPVLYPDLSDRARRRQP